MKIDEYNLINSKAIREHCRKIEHKFNTEELAVIIHRNKSMSIDEKIEAYQELINNYPDMEVIERINCKHFDSVKDMIKEEITRIKNLITQLEKEDQDVFYTYNFFYNINGVITKGHEQYNHFYKTFNEVIKVAQEEVAEDDKNEMIYLNISKKPILKANEEAKYEIVAEYVIDQNRNLKFLNICDKLEYDLNINNICLNIPTPFKKGDLLMANNASPFSNGKILSYDKFPIILEYLFTWNEDFQGRLKKGNFDSSDMEGTTYLISEYTGELYWDNVFDYDSWEYCEEKLQGYERILKAVNQLMQEEIEIDLFLEMYKYLEFNKRNYLNCYIDEWLELAGLTKKDIQKIRNTKK